MHLAELLIVCASGLIPGLLLARSAVPALLAINPTIARTLGVIAIDWRVQAFSALVAVLTAVDRLGRAGHSRDARPDVSGPSPPAAPDDRLAGGRRVQRALVSIEVALCVALLMAGAVLIQGLRDLSRRSPGYESAGVLTAQIRLPDAAYETPELRAAVVQRMLDDIRALPGVVSASTTQNAFVPGFSYQTLINVKDRPTPDGQPHTVQFRRVSPDYFKTMRIKTLGGRVFTDDDIADRPAGRGRQQAFCRRAAAGRRPDRPDPPRNEPTRRRSPSSAWSTMCPM